MRPHGRASVSSRNPRAFGICDRCGFLYNHTYLQWQFDYAGAGLINKRILVCRPCNDTPQAQLRAIVLPADPVPIQNPRIQDYNAAETSQRTTSGQNTVNALTGIPVLGNVVRVTSVSDGSGNPVATTDPRVTQEIGNPANLDINAIMPLFETTAYDVVLSPLSISSQSGNQVITVTFASPGHGLNTNDQIAVQGLSNNLADGFYSITVTNPMAFTYQANNAIPVGGLLQGTTLMVTALVGLPYNNTQLPQTGPRT